MEDEELIIRVAAADALVSHDIASDENRAKALAELLTLADLSQSNFLVAAAALNVLDRNQGLLDDEKIKSIAALPEIDPTRSRGTNYVQRLKEKFAR